MGTKELNKYFKWIIDNIEKPLVICDMDYRAIYLNPKAEEMYEKRHGLTLLGSNVRGLMDEEKLTRLEAAVEWFKESPENNKVFVRHCETENIDVYIKAARDEDGTLIGFYNYIESRKSETAKEFDLD